MWTNTYWWELELKKDSSFYLSHSSFNNMNSAPNNPISKRVKKNPTLPDIISGKWKQSSDSIELTYIKAFAGLNQIFNESIILVDLGNTLMLKRNDNFSSFPSKMDLAMPKRNMISN
jgi:hypothetical protein